MTPSDSVAIIAANAVGAIPYFEGGLKGVARYIFTHDNALQNLLESCDLVLLRRGSADVIIGVLHEFVLDWHSQVS